MDSDGSEIQATSVQKKKSRAGMRGIHHNLSTPSSGADESALPTLPASSKSDEEVQRSSSVDPHKIRILDVLHRFSEEIMKHIGGCEERTYRGIVKSYEDQASELLNKKETQHRQELERDRAFFEAGKNRIIDEFEATEQRLDATAEQSASSYKVYHQMYEEKKTQLIGEIARMEKKYCG